MAGIPGNQAWFGVGRQASKGTAADIIFKDPFTGGNITPERPIERLSETDDNRDQGVAYLQRYGVTGSPECYVRDDSIVMHLLGVLGAISTSGAGPNYTHELTPATTLPYMTLFRSIGTAFWENYLNCLYNGLTIKGEAGGALTMSADIVGTLANQLAADPDAGVTLNRAAPYYYQQAAITLGGGSTRLLKSFELNINNNVTQQLTDDLEPYDVVAGKREVGLSFDMIFEDLTEYNKFHYGGAAPSLPEAQNATLYETSATLTFTVGANNSVEFEIPHLIYEEFPIEPDAGGDPIVVSARAVANRDETDPVLTATVENQNAGTVYAAT